MSYYLIYYINIDIAMHVTKETLTERLVLCQLTLITSVGTCIIQFFTGANRMFAELGHPCMHPCKKVCKYDQLSLPLLFKLAAI